MKERIGHYSIVSELGRGGMGVVYKAHEESLNRFVALKVLSKHLSDDDSFVERFKREAQSAASLNHPNIVQVYAIDEFEGQHYFAMEYVRGTSIQEMIKRQGSLDPVVAGRLILQASSGLGAAHGRDIVHRDIKPANLMVDERGLVKITDFGLALLAAGTTRLTATGMFMGTPGYLSPEQCLDEEIDQRTDIYSLGVTLYEMLTGITPLSADSPLALLRQIIDVEPKDVSELRPEVPGALRAILRRMMAKKPADRYTDCAALIVDLQGWLETTGADKTDLSAAVAATISAPVRGINSEPTVVVDSARLTDDKVGDSPADGKRMSAALLAVIIVILMAGVGYAAWHFGVVEDTEIKVAEENDKPVEKVSLDVPGMVEVGELAESATDDLSVKQDNFLADVETNHPETLPENPNKPTFDPETKLANVTDANRSPAITLPKHDEPFVNSSTEIPDNPTFDSETNLANVTDANRSAAVTPPKHDEPFVNSSTEQIAASSSPPTPEPAVGTGVALVSVGEILLAETAADYVRQTLERLGIVVFDGMSIAGVANMLDNGGGSIEELIRPHARYLVYIRADFTGERELYYMGRYDTEYQGRLNLETRDLLDGRLIGPAVHSSIGYTQLSAEGKVDDLLRPKFGPIANDLRE